jgi:hypothetical protein
MNRRRLLLVLAAAPLGIAPWARAAEFVTVYKSPT